MLKEHSVSFVMTTEHLVTVDVDDKVSRVRQLLATRSIHHVPVLDRGKLIGIISTTDLLALGLGSRYLDDETIDARLDATFTIERVMEKAIVTLHPRDSLYKAAQLLVKESFNSLPVVDDEGELVGILTTRDILRFAMQYEDEPSPEFAPDSRS